MNQKHTASNFSIDPSTGVLAEARQISSPNCDPRPDPDDISLIVIHNISLPPGDFGGPWIEQLFTNCLNADAHPYFSKICQLKVSSHLFIDRAGNILQFVPLHLRAWHAGVSVHNERENCNDFSIGIELEGTDDSAYTDQQYRKLAGVTESLVRNFPNLNWNSIVGHSDISPGRKTDPGPAFSWARLNDLKNS